MKSTIYHSGSKVLSFHALHIVLLLTVYFFSCTEQPTRPEDRTFPGMIRIPSAGKSFHLGSVDRWAGDDEKPPMRVSFTYDFWIDSTEVTVKDFRSTTGYIPKEYEPWDTLRTTPICNVTWYDAVLYCNARSKSAGLDTVYSYSGVERTSDGRVFKITGLTTDFPKWGYRLPTEAEWEYCAGGKKETAFSWGTQADSSLAAQYAWSGLNSADTAHEVAGLLPNDFQLYDMAGNAMEWVNDWKSVYRSDTIRDFIGGINSESDERPVKGGSFAHAIEKLRPSSRADIYSTLSSTAARYIGFRCCIGPIAAPQYLLPKGASGTSNPVSIIQSNLQSALFTGNSKVAFVNRSKEYGYLCYVDFSEPAPKVYRFFDMTEVFMPTISPDGEWVAFCTRNEGAIDGSEVYVRKLDKAGSGLIKLEDNSAFTPRWWVDPHTADTFLVYTTSSVDNTDALWNQTRTRMQKIAGGKAIGASVALESNGSFHDGLSSDKQFLATGYSRLMMKDLTHGETKTLFTAPYNGKADGDTSQVCNVSITPDTDITNRVLFLDFGSGRQASTLIGSRYASHQILFMADYSGRVLKWFDSPSGTQEWDHPEWSNHSRFAVASAVPSSGPENRSDVYIIDLEDSVYTPIIHGTELWHPYLWVGEKHTQNTTVNLDSLGQYNYPPSHVSQQELATKLFLFWHRHESLEMAFLGSSQIRNAVEPETITKYDAVNLALGNGDLPTIIELARNYILQNSSNIKLIGISLDMGWMIEENGSRSWHDGMVNTYGYKYDRANNFWADSVPNALLEFSEQQCPNSATWNGYPHLPSSTSGWGSNPPPIHSDYAWSFEDHNCQTNLLKLAQLAKDLSDKNIHLLMLNAPVSPHYKQQPYYGAWGPTQETAKQIIDYFDSLQTEIQHFHFYDANLYGEHDYSNEEFFDYTHLNRLGAEKLTQRLNALFDSWLD